MPRRADNMPSMSGSQLRGFIQKHTVWCAALLLLVCTVAVMALEAFDRHRTERALTESLARELAPRRDKLQATLDHIVELNRGFARHVAQQPHLSAEALTPQAAAVVAAQPRVASVIVTQQLKAVFVHPLKGNEAVIGIDYALHPEFMDSFKRAQASHNTVIDGPIQLLQTGRPGLVVRSPVSASAQPGALAQDVVSMAVDLSGLLAQAGLASPAPQAAFAIRQVQSDRIGRHVAGDPGVFQRPNTSALITLPDTDWEVAAALPPGQHVPDRGHLIRGAGGLVALLLLAGCLWLGGHPATGTQALGGAPPALFLGRQFPLRTLLLGTVLVTVPLVSGVSGWLSFRASMQVAEELEQQHVVELADQLRDRVTAFFDVPRRVAGFNAEQFRGGLLDVRQPEAILRNFLLQLRQQPLLTFVSMGTADGEYLGASRPPLGDDKALRMLHAPKADGYRLKLYRVDDTNRRSTLISGGNAHFNAAERPWFKSAVMGGSLRWYPAYRYVIQDEGGLYDTLGIGMSAPVYDPAGRFAGVVAADVALSQLNTLMKEQVERLGGVAFLAEASGELLASSETEPTYLLHGDATRRLQATESDNPKIRAAGDLIRGARTPEGLGFVKVNDERQLVHWQTLQLPDGPALTVCFALPESRFASTAVEALRNLGVLSMVFVLLGALLSVLAANWLARPLSSLSLWAQQMAADHPPSTLPMASPIQEVSSLAHTVNDMARRLHRHASDLEQQVAERTAALEAANRQLATLSETDGLTGMANRRRFDEFASTEWSRATRNGHDLALLLLDVDLFKPYNDHFGHQKGDEALKQVAAVLMNAARRPGDLAARYGGEEFAIVAAHTGMAEALAMAEGVRAAVEGLAIAHPSSPSGVVTISVGVCVIGPAHPRPLTQWIAKADEALYRAKAQGRNRVLLAGAT